MKIIRVLFLTVMLSLLGFTSKAAEKDAKPKHAPNPEKRFQAIDADKDGRISEAEFVSEAKTRGEAMAKKKGEEADFAAKWEKQAKGLAKKFKKADADKSGSLSLEEFQTTAAAPKK